MAGSQGSLHNSGLPTLQLATTKGKVLADHHLIHDLHHGATSAAPRHPESWDKGLCDAILIGSMHAHLKAPEHESIGHIERCRPSHTKSITVEVEAHVDVCV